MQSDMVRKEDDISKQVSMEANEFVLGSCSTTKSINGLDIELENSQDNQDIGSTAYISSLGSMELLKQETQLSNTNK
ncbi:hypothetical protein V6N11_015949 [Hibiscus sabdariffa]|uniref:Uncharacterized protein n=1 Tax=Hibiscus sabdariffa TaxID=183260 RepID=A0ABR2TTN0_9ROSI